MVYVELIIVYVFVSISYWKSLGYRVFPSKLIIVPQLGLIGFPVNLTVVAMVEGPHIAAFIKFAAVDVLGRGYYIKTHH